MKKRLGKLLGIVLTVFFALAVTACGNTNENNSDNTEKTGVTPTENVMPSEQVKPTNETPSLPGEITDPVSPTEEPSVSPTEVPTSKPDDLSVREYSHSKLPFTVKLPSAAVISETDDAVLAETEEYMIYAFGMDSFDNGIVMNEMDFIPLSFNEEQVDPAEKMLRLKTASIPKEAEATFYNSINDVGGFYCRLEKMEFVKQDGTGITGNGSVMIYGAKGNIGAYVVLEILKDTATDSSSERTGKIYEMLKLCSLSLKQTGNMKDGFVVWTDTIADEIDVCAVFKNDVIKGTDKTEDGILLYYNEEKNGSFLIRHYSQLKSTDAEEQIKTIIAELKKDGVSFSEIEDVKGEKDYKKVKMSYQSEGKECQEVICVATDENGSVWVVDLYGTKQDVEAQESNLSILLWSLDEE